MIQTARIYKNTVFNIVLIKGLFELHPLPLRTMKSVTAVCPSVRINSGKIGGLDNIIYMNKMPSENHKCSNSSYMIKSNKEVPSNEFTNLTCPFTPA